MNVVQSTKPLKLPLQREMEIEEGLGELYTRPTYFVGRKEELQKRSSIVNEYGSIVISQHGGIGKTQLMSKFSETAEGILPSGVSWVTADGDTGQILDSLAIFLEKLRSSRMSKEYRKDLNVIAPN